MKALFDGSTIKVWFNAISTSRNFYNVAEITQEGNAVLIKTGTGDQHLLNFSNVNMIEEIADMDKKLLELQEKFRKGDK
ncbi:hypothetical protein HZF24_06965 [Sedimentibacter hydroxybenzoicus DSM 7310]|uniref:Uncharacterized protein n=1 Tax=Sedimentibacter hydroxybenzoicus DSM 7310 TaxID=1123245 RepID=A0A974BIM1_SEDHY|nr:hypothetical protein [Sedimentibacter hydroxybenzoicus]NYB73879.1 hypothetical protein [Sedimentibacter hydroxybenzoicus DSM 7310]